VHKKGGEIHIFAPISGPFGTRAKLTQTIIPVLKKLEAKSIVSLGEPGKKISKKIRNCEIHTWLSREERQEHMKNARLILFSGGHATCFETIRYSKPSVCIPTQPEQMGNARKLQEMKCSILAINVKQFADALTEMEKKIELYKRNAEELNKYSSKFSGLSRAVEAIEDIL
jgi:UDP:flavonoid glycosyltransferase YjiC (YdhE family)